MPNFTVSPAGLRMIERFEGFLAEAQALPDGRYVVGFGAVAAGPRTTTLAEARVALAADVQALAERLNETLSVPVTQAQFDALASFAFSLGWEAFATSDALRRVQAGEPIAAAMAMLAWRKSDAGGETAVIDVLALRRAAEAAHFLSAETAAAPSVWLRPQIDHACAILGAPIAYAAAPALSGAARADEPLLLTQVVEDKPAKPKRRRSKKAIADAAALSALGVFGLGLMGLGVATAFSPNPIWLASAAAALPGALAALAAFHFLFRHKPAHAQA